MIPAIIIVGLAVSAIGLVLAVAALVRRYLRSTRPPRAMQLRDVLELHGHSGGGDTWLVQNPDGSWRPRRPGWQDRVDRWIEEQQRGRAGTAARGDDFFNLGDLSRDGKR